MEVLLICDYKPNAAATIVDHISAFSELSQHNVHEFNSVGDLPEALDLNKFHVVVIHYSICITNEYYITNTAIERIKKFQGLKIVYIQDDYRWIYKTLSMFTRMEINVVFCLASPSIIDEVYSPDLLPTVRRRETVLTGYVPGRLMGLPKKNYNERTIDVGYRARKLLAWLGEHSQQKWQIAEKFLKDAESHNLHCDISLLEEDRINGDDWFTFLANCKSVLGTESGSSVCDFTGEIQINVEQHLARYPNSSFEELKALYFNNEDGKIMMNVISPRCFEAAALGTLMVLYEGEYSGVLKPWDHYVPLAKDHHNMKEVVEYIKDEQKSRKITEQTLNEVILNPEYSYNAMIKRFDEVVNEETQKMDIKIWSPYTSQQFHKLIQHFEFKKYAEQLVDNKLNLFSSEIQIINNRLVVLSQPAAGHVFLKKPLKPFLKQIIKLNRASLFMRIKFFFTKKIVVFNPLLRKLKNVLIQFS